MSLYMSMPYHSISEVEEWKNFRLHGILCYQILSSPTGELNM